MVMVVGGVVGLMVRVVVDSDGGDGVDGDDDGSGDGEKDHGVRKGHDVGENGCGVGGSDDDVDGGVAMMGMVMRIIIIRQIIIIIMLVAIAVEVVKMLV